MSDSQDDQKPNPTPSAGNPPRAGESRDGRANSGKRPSAEGLPKNRLLFGLIVAVVAAGTAGLTALLMNISERKAEKRRPYVRVVEVTEDTTDPAVWGENWPAQYDLYLRTSRPTKTLFGGHGGSEALPAQKIERDPWLKRMFLGYAFSIDYRDRRGHAYMLTDQEATKRLKKPQSGSCLHCHASVMPVYRALGDGDAMAGFEETFEMSYQELNSTLHEMGHAHPVSCVDCHDPETMAIRVTRPGFIRGIQELAESDAPVPALSSIEYWREGPRDEPYDPNADATRNEMRSFVCGQCHVEYYCSSKMPLTFPWGKGLSVDDLEAYWDETVFPDGTPFVDYFHAETKAPVLKAQHPEFELWSQGVHARAGVSCSDCHMPYIRQGAAKISDHWVRSPLLNINRACQTCHRVAEDELLARAHDIQLTNHDLLQRGGDAIVDLIDAILQAEENGATEEELKAAQRLQRRAQWRLDFIAAENSMGFHAPQEAARILGEAADFARQGQIAALKRTPLHVVLADAMEARDSTAAEQPDAGAAQEAQEVQPSREAQETQSPRAAPEQSSTGQVREAGETPRAGQ